MFGEFAAQTHPFVERKSILKLAKFGCNLPRIQNTD